MIFLINLPDRSLTIFFCFIKVPPMTSTSAELLVQENEYQGRFETKTYFRGEISVKLYKDGQEVLLIELGDLEDIFTRDKGFQQDSKGIFRMTRGQCKARFGIDQRIELKQRPLAPRNKWIINRDTHGVLLTCIYYLSVCRHVGAFCMC